MAWNPSPEVAVARDAANRLKTPFAVIVYLHKGNQIAMASYGKNVSLCEQAGKFGEYLVDCAMKWGMADEPNNLSTPSTRDE